MKIEYKNGANHYYDFEIEKALKNLECGISIETFFKHEAERFEYGADEYFNMLIREVEIESQMYSNEQWEYYQFAFGVGLKEVEKVIIDLQKLNIQPFELKPFAGLLRELSDKQLDKLFKFLTDENKAFSKSIFIDIKTTDRQSFDYIFGGKEKPIQFKPIEWQANNQWLREILAGLQIIKNYHKDTNTLQLSNEIERQTAGYFIKKGKAINIKSTKQLKDKPEYKAITKFLATI